MTAYHITTHHVWLLYQLTIHRALWNSLCSTCGHQKIDFKKLIITFHRLLLLLLIFPSIQSSVAYCVMDG